MKFLAQGTFDGQAVEFPIEVPDNLPKEQITGYVDNYVKSHFGSDGPLTHEDRLKQLGFVDSPGEGSAAPGFLDTLGKEIAGGASDVAGAIPALTNISDPANIGTLAKGALGAARVATSPATAAGAKVGQLTLDATGSPVAAGVADAAGSMGASALMGAAASGVNSAARKAAPYVLPGAQDALLTQGLQDLKGTTDNLLTGRPTSQQLYGVVDQMNPKVASLPNLEKAATSIASNEATMEKFGLESKTLINTASSIKDTLAQPGGMDFQQARDILRRIGQRIDDLRDPLRRSTGSGEELGAMKQLYAGLLDDMEARTPKASRALVAANQAAKREFAVGELNDVIDKGVKAVQGKGPESINFSTMLNNLKSEIRKNELFADAFQPGELEKIEDTLKELSKLPVSSAPRGANYGSGRVAGRGSIGGILGGAASYAAGGDVSTGAALGGMANIAASQVISSALMTDTGRSFLLRLVRGQPGLLMSPRGLALVGAASRAGQAAESADLSDLGPSEAAAADIPPEEIERRESIMGDLSGISAAPASSPTPGRFERLQTMLQDAVNRNDVKGAATLRQLLLREAGQ